MNEAIAESEDRKQESISESKAVNRERLQAFLYTMLGALPPVIIELSSDSVLTVRKCVALFLISCVAGGTALKAFLSQSKRKVPADPEPPPAVAPPNPLGFNFVPIIAATFLASGALALQSCATAPADATVADRASTFANSRAGQALEVALINATLDTALQYLDTGRVDPQKVLANSLDGAAESLRSLAGTRLVESPKAIADSVTIGTGVRAMENTVAPIVAAQVTRQIQDGTHPDQAIENLATVMNKGAADARKTKDPNR